MYAVIRTGGKQYRVAPGDVLKIEKIDKIETDKAGTEGETIEFNDVLAFSADSGSITKPASAKVIASVLGEGRGSKILVFHFKRKKQYKKLQGHRQSFTEVRINEILVDGTTYGAQQ